MNKSRFVCLIGLMTALAVPLTSCGNKGVTLDPKNPTAISIWTYYSGKILETFKAQVTKFNETYGRDKGIIAEVSSYTSVSGLEAAVIASAKKEVGSKDLPSIFFSYADTAYEIEKLGVLADIEKYFSKNEQSQYIDSYIEEGKIGLNGELRIFPFAKSTETFLVNETDWEVFADETDASYEDLLTIENVAEVAQDYYEWTDSLTPDVQNDGKAFFGRDTLANFMLISAKELGEALFEVDKGAATLNVNREVMKKIWDYYYVPILSGYFVKSNGFCSDELGVGKIISYVGSTASSSHFPKQILIEQEEDDDIQYPITAKAIPVPHFAGATNKALVQQGAGMVVSKTNEKEEFASVSFLKWITDLQPNIEFAATVSYLPVKKAANNFATFTEKAAESGIVIDDLTKEILEVSFAEIQTAELYTPKAFDGGVQARRVLTYNLHDKVAVDRAAVVQLLSEGISLEEAVAQYASEAEFDLWLADFIEKLEEAIAG